MPHGAHAPTRYAPRIDHHDDNDDHGPRGWRAIVGGDPREVGRDPDYRYSLANERTFLAWIRTSLALLAGGLAIAKFLPIFGGRLALSLVLMVLGLTLAATSYRRWAKCEAAVRTGQPLPPSRQPALLSIGVTVAGLATAILIVLGAL